MSHAAPSLLSRQSRACLGSPAPRCGPLPAADHGLLKPCPPPARGGRGAKRERGAGPGPRPLPGNDWGMPPVLLKTGLGSQTNVSGLQRVPSQAPWPRHAPPAKRGLHNCAGGGRLLSQLRSGQDARILRPPERAGADLQRLCLLVARAWALGVQASACPAGQEPWTSASAWNRLLDRSSPQTRLPVSAVPLLCQPGRGRLIVKVRGGRPSRRPLMARGLHAGAIWGIDFFLGYKLQMETSCQVKGSPGRGAREPRPE